ncbi:MAG: asparagine synthase (glutamine-hydrolyzing) [Chloroflexota bacterium]|nr:asparagine synthase (glutamine-hydrolyzing) [Chloroflexota bacterium]
MSAALRHRGPDDHGAYFSPSSEVGIAARRLSIIDVAGGHQPLSNEDGSVWAVLNGEIYNYAQLREQLSRCGHSLTTNSDTEVLVHLYEEYGNELVHALEGMFAFALWDEQAGRLLVTRDRFGEKPLFYHNDHGVLTFASELSALRAGVTGADDVDSAALDAFFIFGYVLGPRSLIGNVSQLPPGHLLVWRRAQGSVEIRPYWAPLHCAGQAAGTIPELIDEAEQLFDASVQSRLIADVPVGVFLSGGFDSTLVAALSARHVAGRLQTFTVGYETGQVNNETTQARLAAQAIGADHHEVVVSDADVAVRLPRLFRAIDQPIADQALVAAHAVSECARLHVTVAVDGKGADEVFGGYPKYRWVRRAERLTAVAATAVLPLPRRLGRVHDLLLSRTLMRRQLDWVDGGRHQARDLLYGPRMRSRLAAPPLWAPLERQLSDQMDHNAGSALMELDQRQWLPDGVLANADRASMLVSLEVRTPFLERRLVEFAATVPMTLHRRDGGNFLVRSVLRRVLPMAARRNKTAFRVPAAEWLRGPLAPLLHDQLRHGLIFEEGWFDRAAASRIAGEHQAGRRDCSAILWPVLAVGLWLDRLRGR